MEWSMPDNEMQDPKKDTSWLHSDAYDRPRVIKNPLPRTSILKFGTFRDTILNASKLLGQSLIGWFLSIFLTILIIAAVFRRDDLFFLIANELCKLAGFTVSVFLAVRIFDDRDIASLGLSVNRNALCDFLSGFTLTLVVWGFEFLQALAFGWIRVARITWDTSSPATIFWYTLLNFGIFLFTGWNEEMISRGYHLQTISRGLNRPLAIILSSAIFSYWHINNPGMTPLELTQIFLFGLLMCLAVLRTGQLWLAIGMHAGWDFFFAEIAGANPTGGSGVFHLFDIRFVASPLSSILFEVSPLILLAIIVSVYTSNHKPEIHDW